MTKPTFITLLSLMVLSVFAIHPKHKIRGVNLGSLFIVEPWMSSSTWKSMGCGDTASEWDCVTSLGQENADAAFQKHWDTFITVKDFDRMKTYGLNTVRIPIGHWLVEETIAPGEKWPRGGMKYLDKVVRLAASRNISVVLDLHGAPGVQVSNNAFTGHTVDSAGFYSLPNYDRAYIFLRNVTERVHTHREYKTTIILEVLNEPEHGHDSLITEYYPKAYRVIRDVENDLQVPDKKKLTIQMMDSIWGAGDPRASLPKNAADLVFDNHRYLTYSSTPATRDDYLRTTCNDTFSSYHDSKPLLIGEWSLAIKQEKEWSKEFNPTRMENHDWYRQWWAAQVQAYEKEKGWIFWSWKAELGGDWRWSYSDAVNANIIPKNLSKIRDLAKC